MDGNIRHNKAIRLRASSPAPIWLIQEIEETAQYGSLGRVRGERRW